MKKAFLVSSVIHGLGFIGLEFNQNKSELNLKGPIELSLFNSNKLNEENIIMNLRLTKSHSSKSGNNARVFLKNPSKSKNTFIDTSSFINNRASQEMVLNSKNKFAIDDKSVTEKQFTFEKDLNSELDSKFNTVLRYGLSDEISKESYSPPPKYPIEAVREEMEGVVLLEITTDENGFVLTAQIKESSGFEILDLEALNTIKKWHLSPHLTIVVPINFLLETINEDSVKTEILPNL